MTPPPSVALFGAPGQLGTAIQRLAPAGWKFLTPNRSEIDLSSSKFPVDDWLDRYRPTAIINAAAYNAVEQAEKESDLAYRLNAEVPARLAKWAASHGAYMIHLSTDYVFSGDQNRPIDEKAVPAPLNVYGASKAAGEKNFLESGTCGCLIRTSAVFGDCRPARANHNFVQKILNRAAALQPFTVRDDLTFCPTRASDLAQFTIQRVLERAGGTFHCTNEGPTTWFEWAREILAIRGLEIDLVKPGRGDAPGQAQRPRYTVLACTRRPIGATSGPWKIALKHYLETLPA